MRCSFLICWLTFITHCITFKGTFFYFLAADRKCQSIFLWDWAGNLTQIENWPSHHPENPEKGSFHYSCTVAAGHVVRISAVMSRLWWVVERLRGWWGASDKGHSWAAVGESQGSLRSFLNRPFHTTPTPSTPRNKEEGEEPAEEEDECTVNTTQHIGADLCLFTDSWCKL